jgi:predicted dehydrogenase
MSIGVVGAGQIVATCHLPAILSLENTRVAWVTDRDPARSRRTCRSYGVKMIAMPDDPANLPEADVVLLAIPFGVRAPFYPPLSQRSCAIYVEKPFARTTSQHDSQCALFSPERIACGFQRRSSAAARALRQLIRSQMFGQLRGLRIQAGAPGITTGERYGSDFKMAGGGILFETGIHALDLVLYACDAVSVTISSVKMIRHAGFDIHTEAALKVETTSGSQVLLELLVTVLRYTTPCNTFVFDTARIRHALWSTGLITAEAREGGGEFVLGGASTEYPVTSAQMFNAHWSAFLEGVRSERVNETSAVTSRITTQAIEAIYARGESECRDQLQ